jgi:L-lactate dehydrogenase complex protein LldE
VRPYADSCNVGLEMPRTALFVSCLVDQFFPEVGEAAVRLLERRGRRVEFPTAQTCCGQPAFNMGYRDEARGLARRTVEVFEPYDEVVVPSGSCAAMARLHFPELLADDPEWHQRARRLAAKVFELTELLDREGFDAGVSTFAGKVACHLSCHLLRDLGVADAPRKLLGAVPGVELVELAGADVCCGFGGAFAVKMADLSAAMLDDKLAAAEASGADVLAAADCGCLVHLRGALKRRKSPLRTLHVAEILAWEGR